MPTNEERREVAARLRAANDEEWYDVRDELKAVDEAIGVAYGMTYSFQTSWNRLADLIEPEPVNGETSDGYHTFNELYHHRALLFSVIVRNYPELCWKSKRHHTGDMYDGMFIVGINTPDGQASYHYDIEPYWDMFDCEELEFAPEWDGHTPDQAIERIGKLTRHVPERTCKNLYWYGDATRFLCSNCDFKGNWPISNGKATEPTYCPNCGAKVVD